MSESPPRVTNLVVRAAPGHYSSSIFGQFAVHGKISINSKHPHVLAQCRRLDVSSLLSCKGRVRREPAFKVLTPSSSESVGSVLILKTGLPYTLTPDVFQLLFRL